MSGNAPLFGLRRSVEEIEEGSILAPRFGADGLIPVATTDARTGEMLMQGYMNAAALERTISTGKAHYWSRSRNCMWRKGATSGTEQTVVELRVDDDQDALWMRVEVAGNGASCHVGYRSCFYRSVPVGADAGAAAGAAAGGPLRLRHSGARKLFNPHDVYGDAPSPTRR